MSKVQIKDLLTEKANHSVPELELKIENENFNLNNFLFNNNLMEFDRFKAKIDIKLLGKLKFSHLERQSLSNANDSSLSNQNSVQNPNCIDSSVQSLRNAPDANENIPAQHRNQQNSLVSDVFNSNMLSLFNQTQSQSKLVKA